MAFNPVKRVRRTTNPTSIQAKLARHLRKLAELPPATSAPYLTISLDWRPSGSDPEVRPAASRVEQELHALRHAHWPRGDVFDSISQDIERIDHFLNQEIDPASKGAFIVANAGAGVFETFMLGLPLPTSVVSGPTPALLPLARLDEDHPTYAVLLADQQQATVSLIAQARRVETLRLQSSDYPRKQHSGGWSQRRFQQRADERLMALVRRIVDETAGLLKERDIDALIIAGDDLMTGAIGRTLPQDVRTGVIGTIRLDNGASEREILEATMPIAERAEADREHAAVRAVVDALGAGDGAVANNVDVLEALASGQARWLVMNEDYHDDGWADFEHGRYGASGRADIISSSVDDFEAVPITTEQEMVRLAIKTGAEIEIVHVIDRDVVADEPASAGTDPPRTAAATELDQYGGVAVLLRY